MTLIEKAIAKKNADELASLFLRRFKGEHLDVPFDLGRGEPPREVLVAAYKGAQKDSPTINALNDAIRSILKSYAVQAVADLLKKIGVDQVPALHEIFSFVEDVRPPGIEDCMVEISIKALRLIGVGNTRETITISIFRAASQYVANDEQIAHICTTALANQKSSVELGVALASAAPSSFATNLLPDFLHHLRNESQLKESQTRKVRECVRLSIKELVDHAEERLVHHTIANLCTQVTALAHFRVGEAIHRAVVEGLSLANVSAPDIRRFEDTFWEYHPRKDGLGDPKLKSERHEFGRRVRELAKVTFRHKVPPIRINSFPYAEGAYIHLLRIAMKLGYDIDIDVKGLNYNECKQALIDGEIDLAASNPSIYEQVSNTSGGGDEILESPPLIKFSRYDLLASIPRLREIVLDETFGKEMRDFAISLLGDGQFRPAEDGSGTQAMRDLLEAGRLTCMRRSDTHDVAKIAFSELGVALADHDVVDLGPDEGLEKILDGQVLFYLGGALQNHYGTTVCSSRAKNVLQIDAQVNVHFYVKRKTYEANRDLYDLILRVWGAMPELRDYLTNDPKFVPRSITDLMASLRDDILVSLNRDRGIQIGFSPSFRELQDILSTHDEILEIKSSAALFKPQAEVVYLNTSGVRLVNNQAGESQ